MHRTPFVFLMAATCVSCIAAAQEDIGALVRSLSSGDALARHAAFENAAQFGPEAIIAVAPLLDNERPDVVYAATQALENIAGAATSAEETRKAASNALTVAALATQNRDPLLSLLAYVGDIEVLPALTNLLTKAPESFDAALRAIESIGRNAAQRGNAAGAETVCAALLSCLQRSEGRERIGIINAIGAAGSGCAVDALIAEVQVRGPSADAAAQALGYLGDIRAFDALWQQFERLGSDIALEACLRMIERQPDAKAAKLYARMLDRAQTQEIAAQEGDARHTAVSGDPRVLCPSLRGIGRTAASGKAVKVLLPFLRAARADVYGAARDALVAVRDETATRKMAATARKAEPDLKAALLEIVTIRDAAAATPLLEGGLRDGDHRVRATALRLLGQRADARYADAFLEAAQDSDPSVRTQGVRAWLNLAHAAGASGDTARARDMYHEALGFEAEDTERAAAVEGLTMIAAPETLTYLQPLVGNPALEGPVARCAFAIADKMAAADRAAAQGIFEAALRTTKDRELAKRAQAALAALGLPASLAAERGFVLRWRVIGPFPKTAFDAAFPPESEYQPDAAYTGADEQQVRWRDHVVNDPLGITDLDNFLQPTEQVIAYARAVVVVDAAQDILVKAGSDDGIVCWVNGEKVHENDAARAVSVDEDTKPAALAAGENIILLKIVQGGGDWGFCLRLTNRQGEPLLFRYE